MPLTTDEIALLREVSRWRRNHKVSYFQWRPGKGFGVMTEWKLWTDDPEAALGRRQTNVAYEPDRAHRDDPQPRIVVTRNYYGGEEFRELPTRSVAETIDMLAALGYLPQRFSSAYRAGWHAAEVWHDVWVNGEREPTSDAEHARLFHDPENVSFPAGEYR